MVRWLSQLYKRITTIRSDESVAISDERRSEHTIPQEQSLDHKEAAAESSGMADEVKKDLEHIEHLIRIRNGFYIDIYDRFGFVVRKQLHMLYYLAQQVQHSALSAEEKRHVLAALAKDHDELKLSIQIMLQEEGSFESTNLSTLQALDISSLAHKAYFDLRKLRTTSKTVRKAEKKGMKIVRKASKESEVDAILRSLKHDVDEELARLKDAISDITQLLQKDAKDIASREAKVKALLGAGYPTKAGNELYAMFEQTKKRMHDDLRENIERQRLTLSDAEQMTIAA